MKAESRITRRLIMVIFIGLSSLMAAANAMAEDTATALGQEKNIVVTFCKTPDASCEDLILFADTPTPVPGTTVNITWRVDAAVAALSPTDK